MHTATTSGRRRYWSRIFELPYQLEVGMGVMWEDAEEGEGPWEVEFAHAHLPTGEWRVALESHEPETAEEFERYEQLLARYGWQDAQGYYPTFW